MANIFLILYWLLIALAILIAGMVVYHIWVYYLNKALAVLMIAFFLVGTFFLIVFNMTFAAQIDLSFFQNSVF